MAGDVEEGEAREHHLWVRAADEDAGDGSSDLEPLVGHGIRDGAEQLARLDLLAERPIGEEDPAALGAYPGRAPEDALRIDGGGSSPTISSCSMADTKAVTAVPIPQVGHQMWGMRSIRRRGSMG